MAFVSLDKKTASRTLIIDPRAEGGTNHPLGDLLFSFLDINLKEYGKLYEFCSCNKKFDYDDFQTLAKKYPTVADNKISTFCTQNTDEYELRNFAMYFLLDNYDAFSELYHHDFFYYSDSDMMLSSLDYYAFADDINFYEIQRYFKKIIDFCFLSDDKRIASLTPQEKYFLFSAINPLQKYRLANKRTFLFYPIETHETIRMSLFDQLTPFSNLEMDTLSLLDLTNENIIENVKKNCKLLEVTTCSTVFDFLSFELTHLISQNATIKRCANCGKLFIPSGKYNTDCCDRIPEGERNSCKKIMAQKRRKEKLKKNPIINEYERAYKRNYARVTNHKMSAEDFRLWVEQATKKRDMISAEYEATPSNQLIADFKQYLGNK